MIDWIKGIRKNAISAKIDFSKVKEPPPEKNKDPDSTQLHHLDHEIEVAKRENIRDFHKMINPKVLAWGTISFLFLLFFVILPIGEMEFKKCSVAWHIQSWVIAFTTTSRTVGIGLAALVISNIIKKIADSYF